MTGKELAEITYRIIQNDPILWAKWHEVKTQSERDHMRLEALAQYVAQECIGEVYAHEGMFDTISAIRTKFGA